MADIDLDKYLAQREEARAKDGAKTYKFDFGDDEDHRVVEKGEGDTFTLSLIHI